MDIGLLRGVITAVLFIAFCGVVLWAWSGKRKTAFDSAAQLPLQENEQAYVANDRQGDPS